MILKVRSTRLSCLWPDFLLWNIVISQLRSLACTVAFASFKIVGSIWVDACRLLSLGVGLKASVESWFWNEWFSLHGGWFGPRSTPRSTFSLLLVSHLLQLTHFVKLRATCTPRGVSLLVELSSILPQVLPSFLQSSRFLLQLTYLVSRVAH